MKLTYIKESTISEKREKTFSTNIPSERALRGYRSRVLDYIKNDFIPALMQQKDLIGELKDDVLKIGYKKGVEILSDQKEITPDMQKTLSDESIDELANQYKKAIEEHLKKQFEKFKLSEAVINEGPIGKFIDKIAAAQQDKKDAKAQQNFIEFFCQSLVDKISDITINNITVKLRAEATPKNNVVSIKFLLNSPLTIFECKLQETDGGKGYYFKEIKNLFGEQMPGLTPDIPLEEVLYELASKLGVKMTQPKFNTADASDKQTALQKSIGDDAILNQLYKSNPKIVRILAGIKENLENPTDFEAYEKAFKEASDNAQLVSMVAQFLIKKEFKDLDGLDPADNKSYYKDLLDSIIASHQNLEAIKQDLIAAKKAKDIRKYFFFQVKCNEVEHCEILVKDAGWFKKGSVAEVYLVPEEGYNFIKGEDPKIEGVKGRLLFVNKNEGYIFKFTINSDVELTISAKLESNTTGGRETQSKKAKDGEGITTNTKKIIKKKPSTEKDYSPVEKKLKDLGVETADLFIKAFNEQGKEILKPTDKYIQMARAFGKRM